MITGFAAIIMTLLLNRVSGVVMLEPHLIATKEEYRHSLAFFDLALV